MSEELNRRIRAELKRRGLSERRAGQMMGLSPGTISAILTHPEQNPSPATCLRLGDFLGWDQDMVLDFAVLLDIRHRLSDAPDFDVKSRAQFRRHA